MKGLDLMDNINSASMELLQKGLDAVWLRQKVISNNLANSETPGYKSMNVEFEGILKNIVENDYENTDLLKKAAESAEPVVTQDSTSSTREDGNNVVMDKENIELARAQLQYDFLVSSLSSQISRLKYAINGGNS
jgi:flagellar basal-body rod protein FlgB